MASDLEALYDHYRARGLDEEEATRLTEERLVASPQALQQLILVHTRGYQRWLSRAAGGLRLGFHVVLFALAVVPLLIFSGWVVGVELREHGVSVAMGVVLTICGVIAGLALFKAHQLFVRRERSPRNLHRGLFTMLVLGFHGMLVGLIDFVIALHRAALLMSRESTAAVPLRVAEAVGHSAAVLALGILTAVGAGLVWFVLVNRVAEIEQSESAGLLAV